MSWRANDFSIASQRSNATAGKPRVFEAPILRGSGVEHRRGFDAIAGRLRLKNGVLSPGATLQRARVVAFLWRRGPGSQMKLFASRCCPRIKSPSTVAKRAGSFCAISGGIWAILMDWRLQVLLRPCGSPRAGQSMVEACRFAHFALGLDGAKEVFSSSRVWVNQSSFLLERTLARPPLICWRRRFLNCVRS